MERMPASTVPRRQLLLGGGVAIGIFAVLAVVVGVEEVVTVLGSAPPRYLAAVVAVSVVWLLLWGLSLYTVLQSLGVATTRRRSIAAYGSIVFANNVTPFAQAGGGALAALVVSRSIRADYETSFAAVAGVDTLNLLPSLLFSLTGVAVVTSQSALGGSVEGAMWAMVGAGVGVVGASYLAWRSRRRITGRAASVIGSVLEAVGRVVPRMSPPSHEAIAGRIDRFVDALDRVGGNRRALGTVLVLSTAGWAMLVGALWISLAAVGAQVSVGVVMFAVPASLFGAIIPSPGGAGSIEAALVLVLAATNAPWGGRSPHLDRTRRCRRF